MPITSGDRDESDGKEHERAQGQIESNQEAEITEKRDDAGPSGQSRTTVLESSELQWEPKHKIFLSHSRAQKPFTGHLCDALERAQRFPFFDKREDSLQTGEEFFIPLLKAVKECRVAVLVLSDEFFTKSKWPMMELNEFVKVQGSEDNLLKSKYNQLKIIPVLLGITWDQFTNETKRKKWYTSWESFEKEDKSVNLSEWKNALPKIERINVIEYGGEVEGEPAFIMRVVAAVCKMSRRDVKYDLSHVQSKERLCEPILKNLKKGESSDNCKVQVMALYGMGGVGKTTISRVICEQMEGDFGGKVCHVDFGGMNPVDLQRTILQELTEASPEILVNEHDKLIDLLKERMQRQKVFLVLDNVWDHQIEEAQKYLKLKYHDGSMVLVTSRYLDVHKKLQIETHNCMKMPPLDEEGALDIFLHYSGRSRESINDDELKIVKGCVEDYCLFQGDKVESSNEEKLAYHPLALKVLGSQLGSMSSKVDEWVKILEKFEVDKFNLLSDNVHPVFTVLRPGYDRLRPVERDIFLDLALVWVSKWRCGSLGLRYEWKWLRMIHRKSEAEMTESLNILQRKGLLDIGTDVDQLDYNIHDLYIYMAESEAREGPFKRRRFVIDKEGTVHELRKYPSGSCWPSLERLIIHKSEVQSLNRAKLHFCKNVEVLDLDCCKELRELDVTGMDNLRCVVVTGCEKLVKWKGLQEQSDIVIFRWAGSGDPIAPEFLKVLSSLTALQVLRLECLCWSELVNFPLDLRQSTKLQEFTLSDHSYYDADGSDKKRIRRATEPHVDFIKNLPETVVKIDLSWCPKLLGKLPISSMSLLTKLQDLNLSGCKEVNDLAGLCELILLRKLNVGGTEISELPDDLNKLQDLQVLDVSGCRKLRSLVCIVNLTALQRVSASRCQNLSKLPYDFTGLEKLQYLDVSYCKKLSRVVCIAHATSFRHVNASGCSYMHEPKNKIFLIYSSDQKNFTEHLCNELESVHHFPFFDRQDYNMSKGEEFDVHLMKAVKQCRLAILVLSDEFFTKSKWPMMELNMILKAHESANMVFNLLPLYLGISMEQFKKKENRERWMRAWKGMHEADGTIDLVAWQHTLSLIQAYNGLHYAQTNRKSAFIEKVVNSVCKLLPPSGIRDVWYVKSMERLSQPILQKLFEKVAPASAYKAQVVGLYGTGGVGKTTISRVICNQITEDFGMKVCLLEMGTTNLVKLWKKALQELTEASPETLSIANDYELLRLLEQYMRRQKVFLIIDDVGNHQIEEVAMFLRAVCHDGSMVLVTSRSFHILRALHIQEQHCMEMPPLDQESAIDLLLVSSGHSRESINNDEEWKIVKRCVEKCCFWKEVKGGTSNLTVTRTYHYHPLALKALGSQLEIIGEVWRWEETLKKFEANQYEKSHPVHSVL